MRQWWRRTAKRWIFHNLVPIVVGALVLLYAIFGSWDPSFPVDGSRIIAVVLWSGITAMVVVETTKRLIPLRGFYQRRETGLWLQRRDWQARRRRVRAYSKLARGRRRPAEAPPGGLRRHRQAHRPGRTTCPDRRGGGAASAPGSPARRSRPEVRTAGPPGRLGRRRGEEAAQAGDCDRRDSCPRSTSRRSGGPRSGAGVGTVFNLPAEQLAAQISGAVEAACQEPTTYRRLLDALDTGPRGRDSAIPGPRLPGAGSARSTPSGRCGSPRPSTSSRSTWPAGGGSTSGPPRGGWPPSSGPCSRPLGESAGVHTRLAVVACLVLGGFVAWTARDLTAVVERARR